MSNADKANILVVDDRPENLLVFSSILEDLEQNVITAPSGEEALRQVLDHEFAVILLDVNMPGLDGFETAALIRRRKKSAHTPIIFVTAYADEMHAAQVYSIGAVDYILSPVVPEILRTKVKVFADLFCMTQQAKRQAEERVALAGEQAARAAAEAQLAHAQRLITISEMGAMMAHQLNQPLSALIATAKAATSLFSREVEANPELGQVLDKTAELAKRAADMVRSIRDFARKADLEQERIDLNALIRETLVLVRGEAVKRRVDVTVDLASDIPHLWGHRVHLQQVFLNLILNGLEAMETKDVGERRLCIRTFVSRDRELEASFRDTGIGFGQEMATRLFEPFVTTKKNGMGLGLSICRTIVEAHDGRIWADSNPGAGATVHVALPIGEGGDERIG